jgi:hypothetical protein
VDGQTRTTENELVEAVLSLMGLLLVRAPPAFRV